MRCYSLDDIDDISTYLVMEKFGGVHVIWEPQNKTFRTTALSNNQYKPPPSFTDLLPSDLKLEGELWRPGRVEGHDHVSKCLHSKPPLWSGLQFMVFDAPPMTAQEVYTPYEQRLREKARSRLASGIGDVLCTGTAETFRCASLKDLILQLDRYTEVGAEGLVLRKADSRFKPNIKDNNILKLKKWQDAEARVERWTLTESGKHWSMCCEDINGSPQRAKFQFGVYDVEEKPPGVETQAQSSHTAASDGTRTAGLSPRTSGVFAWMCDVCLRFMTKTSTLLTPRDAPPSTVSRSTARASVGSGTC